MYMSTHYEYCFFNLIENSFRRNNMVTSRGIYYARKHNKSTHH